MNKVKKICAAMAMVSCMCLAVSCGGDNANNAADKAGDAAKAAGNKAGNAMKDAGKKVDNAMKNKD